MQADKRLRELVWYHNYGDCEANGAVLKEYSRRHKLDSQAKIDLCFFYTNTYCVESAIILLQQRSNLRKGMAKQIKNNIIFQSDRRFVKMSDRFEKRINFWANSIDGKADYIKDQVQKNGLLKKGITKYLESWVGIERFCAYVFIETYCALEGIEQPVNTSEKVQFRNGNVFTAGIFNAFGDDEKANLIDTYGIQNDDISLAEERLKRIIQMVYESGGSTNFFELETTLCAYRKHFKGTRYNGYYADRQLQEIYRYNKLGESRISNELLQIRRSAINNKYLGEMNGWDGIRPELKKYYLNTGNIYGYNDGE